MPPPGSPLADKEDKDNAGMTHSVEVAQSCIGRPSHNVSVVMAVILGESSCDIVEKPVSSGEEGQGEL